MNDIPQGTTVYALFNQIISNIRYTPFGARSLSEIAAYNDYFAASGDPISVFLFITAKDGKSMSRFEYMKEVVDVLDYIGSNLTYAGYTFYSMCSDFCQINEPVRQYYNGLVMHQNSTIAEEQERISLTFPIMEVLGKELDLSPNFFGVRTNEALHTLEFLKIVMMQFRANPPQGWMKDDVQIYERKLSTYFHKEYRSDIINTYALSLTYTADEIVRTGLTIFPYLAVGFTIMGVFSVITVYYSSTKMGQRGLKVTRISPLSLEHSDCSSYQSGNHLKQCFSYLYDLTPTDYRFSAWIGQNPIRKENGILETPF
uniref:SSD domain-containing protein n=1 Tax=Heterorhabditis bacteriophora TaxID=37862 RepID=A0A1I7WSS7_HETBA